MFNFWLESVDTLESKYETNQQKHKKAICGFDKKLLRPTKTQERGLVEHLGTDEIYSERQGKSIRVQTPKSGIVHSVHSFQRVNLNPTQTNEKSVVELLGTDKIFSERQGKCIRLQTPKHGILQSVHSFQHSKLRPTQTKEKGLVEHLGTDKVFSKRQGKMITLQTPKDVWTKALMYSVSSFDKVRLNPVSTKVKTLVQHIGTSRVYSERQGKMITLKTPKTERKISGKTLSDQKRTLRHVTPNVKTWVEHLGTSQVYSESQGKVITLQTPVNNSCDTQLCITFTSSATGKRHTVTLPAGFDRIEIEIPKPTGQRVATKSKSAFKTIGSHLQNQKKKLRKVQTTVKNLVEHLGTNTIFSERQSKIITLKTPVDSSKSTSHACCEAVKNFDYSTLRPTTPVVKQVSELIGTNQVFSERQGKCITLQTPVKQKCDSSTLCRAVKCFDNSTLRPTTPIVKHVSELLGTDQVFSERQGKYITLQTPVPQKCQTSSEWVEVQKPQIQKPQEKAGVNQELRSTLLLLEKVMNSLDKHLSMTKSASQIC
jgi:phosphoribosylformylglycinamidine (FGAM) synthase PurS component